MLVNVNPKECDPRMDALGWTQVTNFGIRAVGFGHGLWLQGLCQTGKHARVPGDATP